MSTVMNTVNTAMTKYMPLFADTAPETTASRNAPETFGISLTGRRHRFAKLPCQDRMFVGEAAPGIFVLATADGASGCRFPEAAAEVSVECFKIIASQRQFWQMPEKKFRHQAAVLFESHLRETGYPLDELCATLAGVAVNTKTGECLCFSVGDSFVVSFDTALNFRNVTHSINGSDSSYTIFTNYRKHVERYSYVCRRKLSAGTAGFIVMTDGAEQLTFGNFYDAQQLVAGLILGRESAAEEMGAHIAEVNADDISFAGCWIPSERITSAARSVYAGQIAPAQAAETNVEAGRTKKIPATLPETTAEPETQPEAAAPVQTSGQTKRYAPAAPAETPAEPATAPGKTRRYALPAAPQAPTNALLAYLSEPHTAAEIIGADLGLDRRNFMIEMMVLLRLGLVSVSTADGTTTFRRAA